MNRTVLIAVLACGMAGCASVGGSVPVTGQSVADGTLKNDVAKVVSFYAKSRTKCDKIDAIEVEPVSKSADVRADPAGRALSGDIKERWTAKGCGVSTPFSVILLPDGKGGTNYGVSPEK